MYNHLRLQFRGLPVLEIHLEKFTPVEALELFQYMLDRDYSEADEAIYLEIAGNLGFLPIALRQAISLMLYGPHYEASVLCDKLSAEDRLALLRKGQALEESDSKAIDTVFDLSSAILTKELIETLEYLSVCSPGAVPLDFLQKLTKVKDIDERLEQLYTYSWCERREIEGERAYELHQLVRELVKRRLGARFQEDFIQLVHEVFTDEAVHFSIKECFIMQLKEAFAAAEKQKDERLIKWLDDLYYFCAYRGYGDFYIRLSECVEKLFPEDQWTLKNVYLFRSLILKKWGRLKEAMILLKKLESICEDLSDRSRLARTYGNQALILRAWGKLDEAMTLHKKEEKNKKNLGDLAGLAIAWWNQGLIYEKKGNHKKQMELWQKSIHIDKSMNIPTEKRKKELNKLLKKIKRSG
jgi:tetratricopeptide (TPR) repeat protein